ncbi:hypothetical protein [Streptomyces sp. GD-15H]|uniref:hypothetical protein n=1 Tax=Streptomyces sp. GD-15H TaxID=3129112 RepID=UPI00387368E9
MVDEDAKVIGVISETDLVARRAATPDPHRPSRRFATSRHRDVGGTCRRRADAHVRAGRNTVPDPDPGSRHRGRRGTCADALTLRCDQAVFR